MPRRDLAPNGAPCWIDLFTSDTDATRSFYGGLFGWESEQTGPEYGGYINFLKDGQPIAGCMLNDGSAGAPDTWTIYLATADAQATVAAAEANGGQVHLPPMDVMTLGVMAMVADPGGAAIGIWQPGEHKGFTELAEPNTPSWFELHTRTYEESVRFYESVFGWTTHVVSDEPDFRYTTFGKEEDAHAGIMDASAFLPEGVPSHWSVYFGVEDTDKALERVVELGGTVVEPAMDSPYGRLARAADPTGAQFKLVAG